MRRALRPCIRQWALRLLEDIAPVDCLWGAAHDAPSVHPASGPRWRTLCWFSVCLTRCDARRTFSHSEDTGVFSSPRHVTPGADAEPGDPGTRMVGRIRETTHRGSLLNAVENGQVNLETSNLWVKESPCVFFSPRESKV